MSAAASDRRWPGRTIGLITVAVFLALVARFWSPVYGFTSFIQLDSSNDALKIAAFREHPVYVHRDTGGYVGLYYAQIAYDPLLTSPGASCHRRWRGYSRPAIPPPSFTCIRCSTSLRGSASPLFFGGCWR